MRVLFKQYLYTLLVDYFLVKRRVSRHGTRKDALPRAAKPADFLRNNLLVFEKFKQLQSSLRNKHQQITHGFLTRLTLIS